MEKMELSEYVPKDGFVKVDSGDLVNLMNGFEYFRNLALDNLPENEKNTALDHSGNYDAFLRKYIVISHLRRKEHLWYQVLGKLDAGKYETVMVAEQNEQVNDIRLYMDFIDGLFYDAQELPAILDKLLGMLVSVFGKDTVRRDVWGTYLDAKAEREKMAKNRDAEKTKETV